jgi:hypothetical protein
MQILRGLHCLITINRHGHVKVALGPDGTSEKNLRNKAIHLRTSRIVVQVVRLCFTVPISPSALRKGEAVGVRWGLVGKVGSTLFWCVANIVGGL